MEIGLIVLLVLLERSRPDLVVRRWWAGLPVPRPALPLRVPAPVALAGVDARRLALRISVIGVAFALYKLFWRDLPDDAYSGVNLTVGFYLAFLGLGVLAVTAAIAGRDRGQELLDALPCGPRSRVLGWVVVLTVLAAIQYALLAGLRFGHYETGSEPSYAALLPDAWELAQGPLMLLGGGLLGLLLSRLVIAWVAVPVGVVLGVMWVGSFQSLDLTMLAPLTEWIQYPEDGQVIVEPGNLAWHNGYLLGLCGLGVVAALLVEKGRRTGLLLAGTAITAATVVAGVLSLP